MKKIILPIAIIGVVGAIIYYFKNKMTKAAPIQKAPIEYNDDPTKQPLYDEVIKTLAALFLASEKTKNPSDAITLQTSNANIKASERYDCMRNALRSMSTGEMNALIDFLKNGLPSDIIKFNEYRDIAKKYPLAWSDNPCGYLCTSPDGNTFISGEPCGTKTTPAAELAQGTSSFNGLKGLN